MDELEIYFKKQAEDKKDKQFNIFTALHDEHDETRLHSRFIAYLLSSDREHGMDRTFLNLFIDCLNKKVGEDNAIQLCEDIQVMVEEEYIDILILDKSKAIIIENKIFAGDSNFDDKEKVEQMRKPGYEGQLERYYHTIKTGKNKDGKDCKRIQREHISVVYLTLDGHKPSQKSIGETLAMQDIILIDYTTTIQEWLVECIKKCEKTNCDTLLSKIIGQYDILIKKIASDVAAAKENKEKIAGNIDKAWKLQHDKCFFSDTHKDVYKHIKWHTIADFYDELEVALNNTAILKVFSKPTPEEITKVAHNENESSTTKLVLCFSYDYDEDSYYLANDNQGFTIGIINQNRWGIFPDKEKGNIKFQKFSSNQSTFNLIDGAKRKELITTIVSAIIQNIGDRLNNYINK
jgi:hypothetical protein